MAIADYLYGPFGYVVCAVVVLLLLWSIRDLSRAKSRIWFIRAILQILAIVSLFLALLQPAIKHASQAGIAIILTELYQESVLDSLRSVYGGADIFHSGRSRDEPYPIIDSFEKLVSYERVYILGCGLDPRNLKDFRKGDIEFIPCPFPEGILDIHWPSTVIQNKSFSIQGIINHADSLTEFVLKSPAGQQVSTISGTGILDSFRFEHAIHSPGQYLLELQYATESKDSFWTAQLPIEVLPVQLPKILILEESPSFEFNYLKEFLAEESMQLTLRRKLSTDVYQTEFINMPRINLQDLSSSVINEFDILIIELAALTSLTRQELNSLMQNTRDGGTVLVQLLSEWPGSMDRSHPFYSHLNDLLATSNSPKWVKIEGELSGINQHFDQNLTGPDIRKGEVRQMTLENLEIPLLARKPIHLGQIMVHLLPESYFMLLEGKKELYEAYWRELTELFQATAYRQNSWRINGDFPLTVGDQLELELISPESNLQAELIAGNERYHLNFIQDYRMASIWQSFAWPVKPGWHDLKTDQSSDISSFYIHPPGASQTWESLQCQQKRKANQMYFSKQIPVGLIDLKEEYYLPIPTWIFFLCFTMLLTARWILDKFAI